ncbi:hypothetical protein EHN06_08685 [Marinobacter sp. NP-4(2019)]|uniref:hypothetical protein n=1 Tax=Marinobacter sp. NP-4(2019) TaxID=2488665 RepID=UPI000FC3ED84|nr:hypothetical protein [Marinobacter sp. NP-4(2019)]AZT83608.1 hypothetical protein EHN06_08685 [Marinobacter sp. NP-4(2019)]
MKFLFVALFITAVFLVVRMARKQDPVKQACANEIGQLIRKDRNANPKDIAQVFIRHKVSRSETSKVGRLVMPQLMKVGLEPDEATMVMHQVREAYNFVPESYTDS